MEKHRGRESVTYCKSPPGIVKSQVGPSLLDSHLSHPYQRDLQIPVDTYRPTGPVPQACGRHCPGSLLVPHSAFLLLGQPSSFHLLLGILHSTTCDSRPQTSIKTKLAHSRALPDKLGCFHGKTQAGETVITQDNSLSHQSLTFRLLSVLGAFKESN